MSLRVDSRLFLFTNHENVLGDRGGTETSAMTKYMVLNSFWYFRRPQTLQKVTTGSRDKMKSSDKDITKPRVPKRTPTHYYPRRNLTRMGPTHLTIWRLCSVRFPKDKRAF